MTISKASTADLLNAAEEITTGTENWTPDQRETFIDAELGDIVEELQSRGHKATWDYWVATGEWNTVPTLTAAARLIAGAAWDDRDQTGTVADQINAVADTPCLGTDGDLTDADRRALSYLARIAGDEAFQAFLNAPERMGID